MTNFNSSPPLIMHIDLNSCFASVEQQANPLLRGRPVAVAAYTTPSGCIIAPSIEAKKLGIKVGMRVKEGKLVCPSLVVLSPDPWKYRYVHLELKKLLSRYTPEITPKSIDEFVLDFKKGIAVSYTPRNDNNPPCRGSPLKGVALEIKKRIKEEVGDWLTVSIGIAPNRFLAKLASNLHKPDGLDEINEGNHLDCFAGITLTDLPYIKTRNAIRLNSVGIRSVVDFYNAPLWKLKAAFHSINSYYWHLRLHGYEIDDVVFARRSYGNSYALPKAYSNLSDLSPIISKLTEKTGFRLRRAGYTASGVHLAIVYKNGSFWHKGMSLSGEIFESSDLYKKVIRLFCLSPFKLPVGNIFISVYGLKKNTELQLDIFEDVLKKKRLSESIDRINERWGDFIITPARMLLGNKNMVPDRIAFGGVKELEEFTLNNANQPACRQAGEWKPIQPTR